MSHRRQGTGARLCATVAAVTVTVALAAAAHTDTTAAAGPPSSEVCRPVGQVGNWVTGYRNGHTLLTAATVDGLGGCTGREAVLTLTAGRGNVRPAHATVDRAGTAQFTFPDPVDAETVTGFTVTFTAPAGESPTR